MAARSWLTKSTVRPSRADVVHLARGTCCWNSRVADGEHLVDEQDLRLEVRGDREREPHVHPARVALHRRVEEPLDLGELDDLVELARRSPRVRMPRIAPFRKTFSRPVSSGWKPVPTSSSDADAAADADLAPRSAP